MLQVDSLQDSDVHMDSAREDEATTTDPEVDTEVEVEPEVIDHRSQVEPEVIGHRSQVDPDMESQVKPSTSASGMGSIEPYSALDSALNSTPEQDNTATDDNNMSEKQPLTDSETNAPETNLDIDLEKGQTSTNGGVTPKDVIVVTTEGQTHKDHMKFLRKREIVFCMIGGVAFLIGLVMIIVGLLVMQGKCDNKKYWVGMVRLFLFSFCHAVKIGFPRKSAEVCIPCCARVCKFL